MRNRCANCGKVIPKGKDLCPDCAKRLAEQADAPRHSAPPAVPSRPPPPPSSDKFSSKGAPIVLEGKYRLQDEIGRGAMGTVFRAMDESLERRVAIKFLKPEYQSHPEYRDRFKKEAIAMARIQDQNVVQIYAFGEGAGTSYFVMEYIDGDSVEEIIDAYNRRGLFIPLHKAMDIIEQAALGLAAIHKAGVVHRDVKPGNCMIVNETGRAVIMDFGLVHRLQEPDTTASRHITGTPAYIAPELVEQKPGVSLESPLSDIYSFGAMAYEILTGSIPFGGETWMEILRRHLADVPALPSARRPGLPESIDRIIMRALDKDPAARFKSAEELVETFSAVDIDNAAEHASRPPRQSRGSRSSSGRYSSPDRTTPKDTVRSTPGYHGRLLVIDPDSDFRSMVHRSAKAAVPGSRILSASSGTEAMDIIERFVPDAVVLDMDIAEMNGLEVCATIRGDERTKSTEIVVAAKKLLRRERDILQGLGVRYFLTKPVDPHVLAEVLRPILEKRSR